MIQCAGSRDRRRLPYCSRLCCMIALKHSIRLKQLFPEMKVTICYLEMRTAGVGYENWYLAARRAGVEFLRGTPPDVQFDERGPAGDRGRGHDGRRASASLRPDLVVLSHGHGAGARRRPAWPRRSASTRDEDGFVEILDRKNRATETTREGIFVCGSAAGPKALVECNTEASAVAAEIHNFLGSAGRRMAPRLDGARRRLRGLRRLRDDVPVRRDHAGRAAGRHAAPGRGQGRRQAGRDRRRGLPRLRHLRRQLPRDGDRPQPHRRRPVRPPARS